MAEPATKDEIVAAFGDLVRNGSAFWGGFPPEVFIAPIGEAWSPADNLRHLRKSTKPVTNALRMPSIVPSLLFGKPAAPSRSFSEVRDVYQAALAGGVTAGKFTPAVKPIVSDAATYQKEVIGEWSEVVNGLAKVVDGFSEAALDASQLPHPAIGKLTVREMLFFTLYHHTHHAATVTRRLAAAKAMK